VWTAVVGTVFIAVGAFWLSFTALADLANASGIAATQAWAWPLIVDGIIVVGTVAVVALAGQRGAWYPWMLLMIGCGIGRRELDPRRCRGRCRRSSRARGVSCRSPPVGASRDHTPDGRSHSEIPARRLLHSRHAPRPVHRSRPASPAGCCSGEGCPQGRCDADASARDVEQRDRKRHGSSSVNSRPMARGDDPHT